MPVIVVLKRLTYAEDPASILEVPPEPFTLRLPFS